MNLRQPGSDTKSKGWGFQVMSPAPRLLVGVLWAAAAGCGNPGLDPSSGNPTALPSVPAWLPSVPTRPTEAAAAASGDAASFPRAARNDDWFEDVTAAAGVQFSYRNGREGGQYTVLESIGGGVALIDYDRDQDLDLMFVGGGQISAQTPPAITGLPPGLFRNEGDWRFSPVTRPACLDAAGDYSHACISADYDRDGFPDLLITAFGRCRLLHNQGDGTFRDVSREAGIDFPGWSTAAAWADVDRDGWLDLYVAQYLTWKPEQTQECLDSARKVRDICPPQAYPPAQDRMFRNRQDGTFGEVTSVAGLSDQGRGLGVLATDLNDDGWVDFYVVNDVGVNHLYRGGPGVRFEEIGVQSGVACSEYGLAESGMGVDVADYNGDGWPDLWVTNFELENNSLYRGSGDGVFTHATVSAGLAGSCFPYVGFGTCFDDLNGDGWPDLFISNGNVYYQRGKKGYRQPCFLFQNTDGRRFADVSPQGGPYFSVPHVGRGMALGDLDNDGAPDLVVVHQNEPVALLRNRLASPAWVGITLRGTSANCEAIGARVSVPFRGRHLVRWVRSGAGYFSQFDQRLTFPGSDGPLDATVTWPGGRRELFSALAPGRYHEIVEGEGAAQPP
jgi:enediyne biosynthesis protein E4